MCVRLYVCSTGPFQSLLPSQLQKDAMPVLVLFGFTSACRAAWYASK